MFGKKRGENLKKINVPVVKTKIKKSKKLLMYLAIIIVIILTMLTACDSIFENSYVATLKEYKPYDEFSLDYETVFNKYIDSLKWETIRIDSDYSHVVISGTIDEVREITIKIRVGKYQGMIMILKPEIIVNGTNLGIDGSANLIFYMFDAYEKGYDNLTDYLIDRSETE